MARVTKLEVGDLVSFRGIECYVGEINRFGDGLYIWSNCDGLDGSKGELRPSSKGYKNSYHIDEDDCSLIRKGNLIGNMNILEKFKVSLMGEPEKSFRLSGITNGDDLLTSDGTQIFLSWMLKKHGDDFKKEVVDGLLKEDEKKAK